MAPRITRTDHHDIDKSIELFLDAKKVEFPGGTARQEEFRRLKALALSEWHRFWRWTSAKNRPLDFMMDEEVEQFLPKVTTRIEKDKKKELEQQRKARERVLKALDVDKSDGNRKRGIRRNQKNRNGQRGGRADEEEVLDAEAEDVPKDNLLDMIIRMIGNVSGGDEQEQEAEQEINAATSSGGTDSVTNMMNETIPGEVQDDETEEPLPDADGQLDDVLEEDQQKLNWFNALDAFGIAYERDETLSMEEVIREMVRQLNEHQSGIDTEKLEEQTLIAASEPSSLPPSEPAEPEDQQAGDYQEENASVAPASSEETASEATEDSATSVPAEEPFPVPESTKTTMEIEIQDTLVKVPEASTETTPVTEESLTVKSPKRQASPIVHVPAKRPRLDANNTKTTKWMLINVTPASKDAAAVDTRAELLKIGLDIGNEDRIKNLELVPIFLSDGRHAKYALIFELQEESTLHENILKFTGDAKYWETVHKKNMETNGADMAQFSYILRPQSPDMLAAFCFFIVTSRTLIVEKVVQVAFPTSQSVLVSQEGTETVEEIHLENLFKTPYLDSASKAKQYMNRDGRKRMKKITKNMVSGSFWRNE